MSLNFKPFTSANKNVDSMYYILYFYIEIIKNLRDATIVAQDIKF